MPIEEGARLIAPLSLRDFADDLVALVDSLDSPPLIVGHSIHGKSLPVTMVHIDKWLAQNRLRVSA